MQMFSNRKVEPAAPMSAPPPAPTPKPAPAATPNGAPESSHAGGTLSSGVSIKGTVKFQKELVIDGEVDGRIEAQGRLTVGKQARIKGDIKTRSVIVDGTVNGTAVMFTLTPVVPTVSPLSCIIMATLTQTSARHLTGTYDASPCAPDDAGGTIELTRQ